MRISATPRPVQRLIDEFSRLPGIGPKSASRLTYFLLQAPEEHTQSLAEAVVEMKTQTRFCSICFNITTVDLDPCLICSDEDRGNGVICVVATPLDSLALERTSQYQGRYHVLHGTISPVDGIGPDDLRIKELIARIESERIKEVIMATNPNLQGEATAMYLHLQLQPLGVQVTRLARGLPVGGDLEYADETTLARALEGRNEM